MLALYSLVCGSLPLKRRVARKHGTGRWRGGGASPKVYKVTSLGCEIFFFFSSLSSFFNDAGSFWRGQRLLGVQVRPSQLRCEPFSSA